MTISTSRRAAAAPAGGAVAAVPELSADLARAGHAAPAMHRAERALLFMGAALAAVALLSVLGRYAPAPAAAHPGAAGLPTAAVAPHRFRRTVIAVGSLRPTVSTTVGAQVSGTVASVEADFNDRVSKGQVLLRLDPAAYEARHTEARAEVRTADATLARARDALARAQRLAAQGFVSTAALDDARVAVRAALAAGDAARARARAADLDLRHCVVRAPIAGVVLARRVARGQTLSSAFQVPDLFVIAGDLSSLEAVVQVRESDVPDLPPDGVVELRVDAFPDRRFTGRIRALRLSDERVEGQVTYPLVLRVDNPDGALRPGMTVEARIPGRGAREHLSVPVAALRYRPAGAAQETAPPAAGASSADRSPADEGGPATLWVPGPDGRPRPRPAWIGDVQDGRAALSGDGWHAGDRVIVGGPDEAASHPS